MGHARRREGATCHPTETLAVMPRLWLCQPTVVGLGMIPFLPAFVDYPAEVAIDTAFMYGWPHPRGEHSHAYNLETWEPACPHAHGEADAGGSDGSTGAKQA